MKLNTTPVKDWDRKTPNDGLYLRDEFGALYNNFQVVENNQMPVGAILMFDGSNWQDNITLPGWYACIPENKKHGCPDLTDRFIMGADQNFQVKEWDEVNHKWKILKTPTRTGGSNDHTLSNNELPEHSHDITHEHTGKAAMINKSHTHKLRRNDNDANSNHHWKTSIPGGHINGSYSSVSNASVEKNDDSHEHKLNIDKLAKESGTTGKGLMLDTRNKFYSVIFIRRCK